ncbi:MAG: hypothetical protein FJ267_18165, partial [Planctomycetes bacterium]|nr:hypothetical protein [Planctomycetota bacterium]
VERGQVFTGIIRDLSSLKELQNRILEIASEEQRRIGQELHDGVAQELTGISLFVRTMMNRIDNIRQNISSVEHSPARMPTDLEGLYDIAQTVGQRLNETHRHVQELSRGMMPVQVDANGLQAALEELTSALNKTGIIDCHFDCLKSIELSDNTTATHLYRIAQEAVNNSIRHAQASRIDIRLEKIRSGLQMEIRDNGIGFKPEKKKSGIRKGAGQHLMEYRASLIGGQIQIENLPEGGTLVRCVCLF